MSGFFFVTAIALPLLAGMLAALLLARSSWRQRAARSVTFLLTLSALSALVALYFFDGTPQSIVLMPWLASGDIAIEWSLYLDSLSAVMVAVVTSISALIHIYSLDYMKADKSLTRFFCYLSLFTFAMLLLVSGGNLLVLFVGWEAVGLCSYWLIGFWHSKRSASLAAVKAFIYNRFGDTAFIIGVVGLVVATESLDWQGIESWLAAGDAQALSVAGMTIPLIPLLALCLLVGAMAKSAQWLLHGWLPDAMEGPTPVSALLHAATMVTAGVFLILRLQPLFESSPFVMDVIMLVGALTALCAALTACAQYDIKRMIAWSTCSQIGYMFMALGAAAWGAAFFHLVTHAFFKALLFLAAGSVIHALHGEQDVRAMGGLRRPMPYTFLAMTIAAAALMGVPLLSGFYSKEAILEAVWLQGSSLALLAWSGGIIAAFLTALYASRLIVLPFLSSPSLATKDARPPPHEASAVMLLPMTLLALAAIFIGMVTHHYFIPDAARANVLVHFAPLMMAAGGILVALVWLFARFSMSGAAQGITSFLRRGWRIDRLYHFLWQRNMARAAHSCAATEKEIIDQFGPDGIAALIQKQSDRLAASAMQGLARYNFLWVILVTLLVTWYGLHIIGETPS